MPANLSDDQVKKLIISRLQELRTSFSALSDREFGELGGMYAVKYSRLINGHRPIDVLELYRYAINCHVSADWLLGISESRYPNVPKEIDEFATLFANSTQEEQDLVVAFLKRSKNIPS